MRTDRSEGTTVTEHGPDTLAELAADRRDHDLPVEVHVVGYFEHDPPRGLDAARRVAELLTDEGGTVRELGDDLGAGDVVWVRIDERSFMADEKRLQIEKLSTMVRMKQLAGIVTFTYEVPPACNRFLDARVWAKSGGVDRVERLQFDPYNGETTAVELDGLGDHTDDWWDCPACGADTQINRGDDGPNRYCTDCDWSVTIPRPDDHGGDGDE